VSRIRVGRRTETYIEWRDLWIGVFVSQDAVYICPVPTVVIRIGRRAPR
jgi:hypothetical protein